MGFEGQADYFEAVIDNPLLAVVEDCLVQIWIRNRFAGTGFFIGPGFVMTCAHVIATADATLEVRWKGRVLQVLRYRRYPEEPNDRSEYYPLPDVAVVEIEVTDNPCVVLANSETSRLADLVTAGFSQLRIPKYLSVSGEDGPSVSTLTLEVRGTDGHNLRLSGDSVVQGMSGSPVVDYKLGRVVGMIKASSHSASTDRGIVWCIPAAAISESVELPTIRSLQRSSTAWQTALNQGIEGVFDWPRPRARRDRPERPSALLAPDNDVIPFMVSDQYDKLSNWVTNSMVPTSTIQLVCAPGGTGKSRLAMQLARLAEENHWISGIISSRESVKGVEELMRSMREDRFFIAIDYAETLVPEVETLLEFASGLPADRYRILLLARSDGPWWATLSAGSSTSALIAPVMQLPPVTAEDRLQFIETARRSYAGLLGVQYRSGSLPPYLLEAATKYQKPLDLLAAVLLVTLNERDALDFAGPPLDAILMHERRYWNHVAKTQAGVEFPVVTGLSDRILALPTIYRAVNLGQGGARVAQVVQASDARLTGAARPLALALRHAYPPETSNVLWGTLTPDRLGERLVTSLLLSAVDTQESVYEIRTIVAPCDEDQARSFVILLARICGLDIPGFDDPSGTAVTRSLVLLRLLLQEFPEQFLPACIEACAAMAEPGIFVAALADQVGECRYEVLQLAARALPRWHPSLAPLAVEVEERLVQLLTKRLSGGAGLEEIAPLGSHLARYALRLIDVGRYRDARQAALKAVEMATDLAVNDPRFLPELALNLVALGRRFALSDLLDHRTGASGASMSPIDSESSNSFVLAASAEVTDLHRAVDATSQAVRIFADLADMNPERWQLLYADALTVLASSLLRVGEQGGAEEVAARAVDIATELAGRPEGRITLQGQLSSTLHICGYSLANGGGPEQGKGVRMMDEAVRMRRSLYEASPLVWGIELARSLENRARFEMHLADANSVGPSEQWGRIGDQLQEALELRLLVLETSLRNLSPFMLGRLSEPLRWTVSEHEDLRVLADGLGGSERGQLISYLSTMTPSIRAVSTDLATARAHVGDWQECIKWRWQAVHAAVAFYFCNPTRDARFNVHMLLSFLAWDLSSTGRAEEASMVEGLAEGWNG